MSRKTNLVQFPAYDGDAAHWVGSREYWESVLSREKNDNPDLHTAFGELHKQVVDLIVAFCKEHDLHVDEVSIRTDGILGSKAAGEWTGFTDSSMAMYSIEKRRDGSEYVDREHPFLYQI